MYTNEIIEMEDSNFNHYIHHFDEVDSEYLDYNDEYEFIEASADYMEEIIWE